jgi:inner membrane protein involved in colicin E2 resistance
VNRRTIRYGIAACIVALVAAIIYAIVRLYVLWQRMDSSILLVNVIGFAAIAGVLIYLTKKDKDLEEEEIFRD